LPFYTDEPSQHGIIHYT